MNGGQNPLDKLKSVDWRGIVRTATNKVKQYTLNLSPLEIMVEEATNLDQWGPHGSVMSEIAEACYDPEGHRQVLGVLARRLQEKDEHWRMCYKALLLLEFLVKHGPTKITDDVISSLTVLDRLQRFQYKDANGKDHGANVRHRAQELAQLVNDPETLQIEREKARANKLKYKGVSGDDMRRGATGFGNTSTSSSNRSGGGFNRSSLVRPGGGNTINHDTPTGTVQRTSQSSPTSYTRGTAPTSFIPRNEEALAATRARIERLKLEEQREASQSTTTSHNNTNSTNNNTGRYQSGTEHYGTTSSTASTKKKLTDVKVNPKIAASLGLKLAPPAPRASNHLEKGGNGSAFVDDDVDLLGDLDADDETHMPSLSAAVDDDIGGGWDAFGLDNTTADTTITTTTTTITTKSPSSLLSAAGGAGASPTSKSKNQQTVTRTALPEDAFSDLTGLNKPLQPMMTGGEQTAPGYGISHKAGDDGINSGYADGGSGFVGASSPVMSASASSPTAVKSGKGGGVVNGSNDPFADLL